MEIYSTRVFDRWFAQLKDRKAKANIEARLRRITLGGNLGDCEAISNNISELRIDYGPGYRVYLARQGETVVILLAGGNKASQARDINKAKMMVAAGFEEDEQ